MWTHWKRIQSNPIVWTHPSFQQSPVLTNTELWPSVSVVNHLTCPPPTIMDVNPKISGSSLSYHHNNLQYASYTVRCPIEPTEYISSSNGDTLMSCLNIYHLVDSHFIFGSYVEIDQALNRPGQCCSDSVKITNVTTMNLIKIKKFKQSNRRCDV